MHLRTPYSSLRLLIILTSILLPLPGLSTAINERHVPDSSEPPLEEEMSMTAFGWKVITITTLVLLGGVFAGLTIGLMGMDETNLQVLIVSGKVSEQKHAEKVLALLQRGKHWVLVTLLLSNVIVNETLPIIMDSVFGGGWPAVLMSTALIVLFGEIIPQAFCVRYGLVIGANCARFVLLLMYLLYPIARPIAELLDYCLGEHRGTIYRKPELKTFVSLHKHEGIGSLTEDEVTMIGSVLELSEKPVSVLVTPLENLYILSADHILDQKTVDEILSAGYSRIPVYEPPNPTNFIGMLLVKKLINYDFRQASPVRDFPLCSLPETAPTTSCLDILKFFQEGRSHMVVVSEDPGGEGGAIGVVTLEDIIEELIGEQIIDETDVYVDGRSKIKVIRQPPHQMRSRLYPYVPRQNVNALSPTDSTLVHITPTISITHPDTANQRRNCVPNVYLDSRSPRQSAYSGSRSPRQYAYNVLNASARNKKSRPMLPKSFTSEEYTIKPDSYGTTDDHASKLSFNGMYDTKGNGQGDKGSNYTVMKEASFGVTEGSPLLGNK
ncbi:5864_t:CDS:10 [Paraglomus occultum]|uniref:5864_t:CDS:1 n=1 Tax=Paraglomus occultum TaxID=144539 RepID=A0A9N9BEH1_9GLOM|nr:5864_t:CDS:10 [Paraglomus occultum]